MPAARLHCSRQLAKPYFFLVRFQSVQAQPRQFLQFCAGFCELASSLRTAPPPPYVARYGRRKLKLHRRGSEAPATLVFDACHCQCLSALLIDAALTPIEMSTTDSAAEQAQAGRSNSCLLRPITAVSRVGVGGDPPHVHGELLSAPPPPPLISLTSRQPAKHPRHASVGGGVPGGKTYGGWKATC